jgi:hypothetical protein
MNVVELLIVAAARDLERAYACCTPHPWLDRPWARVGGASIAHVRCVMTMAQWIGKVDAHNATT